MSDSILETYKNIKKNQPLIHCITNYVSMDIMANIVLALGASPAMVNFLIYRFMPLKKLKNLQAFLMH